MLQKKIRQYLVNAPGRVGGHVALGIVRSAGELAVHTHDPWYKTDHDPMTGLILVYRRDVVASLLSNAITWRSTQSHYYETTQIEPFELSKQEFIDFYRSYIWHSRSIDFTRLWGRVDVFYFEDFVNNHDHILTRLGLVQDPTLLEQASIKHLLFNQAPYSYRDVISNHEDLRNFYNTELKNMEFDRNPLRPLELDGSPKTMEVFK